MTAERDGKSAWTGQPDLLASLPPEGPPASRPDPGIDPAVVEELLTEVRVLREQVAGLKEAVSADRPAPAPEAAPEVLTREALEAWGDGLVARVAEAARPADALAAGPGEDAAAALDGHAGRIEEAAVKAAAAAERIDRGMATTADRVAAGVEEAAARIEKGLAATRSQVIDHSGSIRGLLYDVLTQTAGPKFGLKTVLVGLIVFVLGMLLESHIHLLYRWQ